MKKRLKQLMVFLTIFSLLFILNFKKSFADVGDFETYDSGGSSFSSGSSWDSGSSWGSSWDSDSSYSSGSSYSGDNLFFTFFFLRNPFLTLIILSVMIGLFFYMKNRRDKERDHDAFYGREQARVNPLDYGQDENRIESIIKQEDEFFNKDEFLSWTRDLFIKLQYAWSDRDWSVIRCFETNELFEQHSSQLERYKVNKQINKLERVSVNWARLYTYSQSADKEILTVALNSKMIDYIVDEESGKVLKGDPNLNKVNTYKLTFIRKKGVKTKAGETTLNTTNCPNCGAPTEITSAGKCTYCGSIITTGEYNWVLSNLERM